MTSGKEAQLLQRLLEMFKSEARERITAIAAGLSDYGGAQGAARAQLVESIFREAHSLKAAAQSVGQRDISLLCQALESVFTAIKRGEADPPPELLARMQAAADTMDDLLAVIDATPDAGLQARAQELAHGLAFSLVTTKSASAAARREPETGRPPRAEPVPSRETMAAAETRPAPAPEPTRTEPAPASAETVRLSAQKLDSVLRQVEEMLTEKSAMQQLAGNLAELRGTLDAWRREKSKLLGAAERADAAAAPNSPSARLARFLDWSEAHIGGLESALTGVTDAAETQMRRLGSKVDGLLWDVKEILTVPAASLQPILQRAVRDLAREQHKDVEFVFRGGLELDRRILQELKDPLLHLVRNCIDHGIESPTERQAAGKPARATVSVGIELKENDRAEVTVSDDGAGIAVARLADAAQRMGLPVEAAEAELVQLVFQSGVSTSPMITDISGRGLGLAIVREKVERLGGNIAVESEPGRGTTFRLVVPLSLATYRGIAVSLGDRLFIFPGPGVAHVARARRSAVTTIENRAMLTLDAGPVPLVSLREVLELPPRSGAEDTDDWIEAVVVGAARRQVAFEVDAIEDDREILMKPLGRCLVRVRNIQGATILPSGGIALILNIHDLVKSAARVHVSVAADAAAAPPAGARSERPRSILVVEDSITARGLLRSILESAGYRVKTAVDGMEAWSALHLEPFDLVVSDVEMPRMNGFDLTSRIRADQRLADLPVILVTALESREDRERGVGAGANAYILKGGFEQGMLLEAVRRLV